MDQTPRLRSGAFPKTPETARRPTERDGGRYGKLPAKPARPRQPIPTLRTSSVDRPNDALIPEHIIDAPTQRLFVLSLWFILLTWHFADWMKLKNDEEQSLWLFMKWVAVDGVFLFGLPGLRIPWLQWSSTTMMLLFCAHAFADGMLMFRIPIPLAAGVSALGRSFWGAYELAVNEHSVNPDTLRFNESLILGRQIIHILPEGSAVLNAQRQAFCIDGANTEASLPITINATNPVAMELLRTDLETQANETLKISKGQIKQMRKEASRMISYSDDPTEPKTLYFTVKKPGLYVLSKVVDESNLQVARKRLAHTVVAACPKAAVKPSPADRCRGELSDVSFEVTGAPPLSLKYRKVINRVVHDGTIENILPSEDFSSPLARQGQAALVLPNKIETGWARPQTTSIAVSEGLVSAGSWVYYIDEIKDAFGNNVTYSHRDDGQTRRSKSVYLHQAITVHERPTVNFQGCSPQNPLKVAKGQKSHLPLQYGSTGKGEIANTAYHLEYRFSPEPELSEDGAHLDVARSKTITAKNAKDLPEIQEPGMYTITGVSTDFCKGEVMEPASCLLQNPPQPQLSLKQEEIFDKCAGSPIGLRVDLDLIGTPPFEVLYRMTNSRDRHHTNEHEKVIGLRGQMELTPKNAGHYKYEFMEISDAVYKNHRIEAITLEQDVKPSASARFLHSGMRKVSCIDDEVSFPVELRGEGPFRLEYEIVHNRRREKKEIPNVTESVVNIKTPALHDGGDYTIALASVTDKMGCKEFLKDEVKISVRHQKPRVGFRNVDGTRTVKALEGKKVSLPLRLEGDGPWNVQYLDHNGKKHTIKAQTANERITVSDAGVYELVQVEDDTCPGVVDDVANEFHVAWIPRPRMRLYGEDISQSSAANTFVKREVCEGEEDATEVLLEGAAPFHAHYTQSVKLLAGAVSPKGKDLRAAVNIAGLRMDTSQAGMYEYKFGKLTDANYDHNPTSFAPIVLQQRVNERPSAAFTNPGKTYSFCSTESDGVEVIPVTLRGQPPFDLEVEIKHHGSARPEALSLPGITSVNHDIRIPRSRLQLGKSAVSLRRVSDGRGCARILDSSTPRVQISVHNAPTITPLDSHSDICVGSRINFALGGLAPFKIHYQFSGSLRNAASSSNTFRRLADKPGDFVVLGVTDSASQCRQHTNIKTHIHPLPSVRVSRGRDLHVDIHEGGEAEILFEFGGTPPFEFTYTRSSNTDRHGGKAGTVLDTRSETSESHEMRIRAYEEGTYEVISIKDRFCGYVKPGTQAGSTGAQKRLGY